MVSIRLETSLYRSNTSSRRADGSLLEVETDRDSEAIVRVLYLIPAIASEYSHTREAGSRLGIYCNLCICARFPTVKVTFWSYNKLAHSSHGNLVSTAIILFEKCAHQPAVLNYIM